MDKRIEIALRRRSRHIRGTQASLGVRLVQAIHFQGSQVRLLQREKEKVNPALEFHREAGKVVVDESEPVQDAIDILFLEPAEQPPEPIQKQEDVEGRLHQDNIKRKCF